MLHIYNIYNNSIYIYTIYINILTIFMFFCWTRLKICIMGKPVEENSNEVRRRIMTSLDVGSRCCLPRNRDGEIIVWT